MISAFLGEDKFILYSYFSTFPQTGKKSFFSTFPPPPPPFELLVSPFVRHPPGELFRNLMHLHIRHPLKPPITSQTYSFCTNASTCTSSALNSTP